MIGHHKSAYAALNTRCSARTASHAFPWLCVHACNPNGGVSQNVGFLFFFFVESLQYVMFSHGGPWEGSGV